MKSKISLIFFIFYCIFFLTQCASRYQSQTFTGGYSETQLESNVYRVDFNGNGFTSKARAIDLCLLRCAELCKKAGYSHFIIVENETSLRKVNLSSSSTSNSTYTVNKYNNTSYVQGSTTTSGGDNYVYKPGTSNTVVFMDGKSTNNNEISYNADIIIKSVKSKYKLK